VGALTLSPASSCEKTPVAVSSSERNWPSSTASALRRRDSYWGSRNHASRRERDRVVDSMVVERWGEGGGIQEVDVVSDDGVEIPRCVERVSWAIERERERESRSPSRSRSEFDRWIDGLGFVRIWYDSSDHNRCGFDDAGCGSEQACASEIVAGEWVCEPRISFLSIDRESGTPSEYYNQFTLELSRSDHRRALLLSTKTNRHQLSQSAKQSRSYLWTLSCPTSSDWSVACCLAAHHTR